MKITDAFRVCFRTPSGGCTESQGYFRTREDAAKWAGRRKAWIVLEALMPGEKVKWTRGGK